MVRKYADEVLFLTFTCTHYMGFKGFDGNIKRLLSKAKQQGLITHHEKERIKSLIEGKRG